MHFPRREYFGGKAVVKEEQPKARSRVKDEDTDSSTPPARSRATAGAPMPDSPSASSGSQPVQLQDSQLVALKEDILHEVKTGMAPERGWQLVPMPLPQLGTLRQNQMHASPSALYC